MKRPVLTVAAIALALAPTLALAVEFPLTGTNTTITFVGAKPNGKHEGGFKGVTGVASVERNDPTTLKLTVDIDMDSLYSDNPKLTSHLKSPDFFGVKSNPKSKFVVTKVEKSGDAYTVTGNLTMIGQTKSVSFPAKIAAADGALSVSSSFSLDRTQWGMTYGKGKIDDQVKMTINVNAKK